MLRQLHSQNPNPTVHQLALELSSLSLDMMGLDWSRQTHSDIIKVFRSRLNDFADRILRLEKTVWELQRPRPARRTSNRARTKRR